MTTASPGASVPAATVVRCEPGCRVGARRRQPFGVPARCRRGARAVAACSATLHRLPNICGVNGPGRRVINTFSCWPLVGFLSQILTRSRAGRRVRVWAETWESARLLPCGRGGTRRGLLPTGGGSQPPRPAPRTGLKARRPHPHSLRHCLAALGRGPSSRFALARVARR
jgi:hypothetical protein